MDNDNYVWNGQWQGPGVGSYVINKNGNELEPGTVIDELTSASDLFQQNEALQARIAELEAVASDDKDRIEYLEEKLRKNQIPFI